jgi:F-type H+-transporting ATPase subunit alpha
MAEYLVYHKFQDVLIIFDDLTKHADAYRELSLLLRRPPGREAYPGDIFYLHARLLERAARLGKKVEGASLTALPIAELQRGNLSAYIPTNLISITDGQILLDADLFNRGRKPAVDVGRSVSRVGGSAQTKIMRAMVENLRLELSQFEEVARFARFGTEVDEATQRQIERGRRLQAMLAQPVHRPLSPAAQVVMLFAANEGYIDDVAPEKVLSFERDLLDYFEAECPEVLAHINRRGELTDEVEEMLQKTTEGFYTAWLKRRTEE